MFTGKVIGFGVPLLIVSGIAGQMFSSKLSGNMVSAHMQYWPYASVDVSPVDTPDLRAYSVSWSACTLNPDFDHRVCVYAAGLAPRSAVKTERIDTLGLDLDISMLSVVFAAGGEDCSSGTCTPFTPASVPLHGRFVIYQGPGSYFDQSNGTSRRQDVSPFGMISSQSFSGNRTEYSANFSGTVGPVEVAPPPPPNGANATLTVMRGQQTYQTVYPVYPPVY